MIKIKIIAIGKIKEKIFREFCEDFLKRLKPYVKIDVLELPAESFSKNSKIKVKKIENSKIVKIIEKYSKNNIFVLDERGEEYTSLKFSEFLNKYKKEELIFVIGGALGLDEKIFNIYNKIALSRMTLPHEMARLILLEQIYRSITISNKKEYHY